MPRTGHASKSKVAHYPQTKYVYTYNFLVNLTLSVDDEIVRKARRRAEALGKSVNQLIREYLEQLAGEVDRKALAEEPRELTRNAQGNSRGWKFNREEIHQRR